MINSYLSRFKSYQSKYRDDKGRFSVSWFQIGDFAFNIKRTKIGE